MEVCMPGIDFKFDELSANVTPGVRMLFQTYTDVIPYPHKMNDALVKAHLTDLDCAVRHNHWQEAVDHWVYTLEPILEMIGGWVETDGPDKGLYGMFEANSCNYQLFEKIEVKPCERLLQCPYKEMLEIVSVLGRHIITLDDVCHKWCIPLWKGFAEKIGFEIEVTPGETCRVVGTSK